MDPRNSILRLQNNERGTALWLVAVLLACLSFALTAAQMGQWQHQRLVQLQNSSTQADNVSRAGLADAINWFRRQASPVITFNPLGSPLGTDTDDSTIGLVRDFSLNQNASTGHLWGRYELHKVSSPNRAGVQDMTSVRIPTHSTDLGLVWKLESVGYTYLKEDPTKDFRTAPNRILATTRSSIEIRTTLLTLYQNSAVFVKDLNRVQLQNYTTINGGSNYGILYYTQSAGPHPPLLGTGCAVNPAPWQVPSPGAPADLEPEMVFGAGHDDLKAIADQVVPSNGTLPQPFPSMDLVYVDGDLTLDATHPLTGNGILIVRGNLTSNIGANPNFSGVIYVYGNASFTGATTISGSLIVLGYLSFDGAGNSITLDQYQSSVLSIARQTLARYRPYHSTQYDFTGIK